MDQRLFIFLLVIWAKVEASNTTTGSNWTVMLRVFENCIDKNDSLGCLQQKVLNFANRMTESKSLEIFEGFKFVRVEHNGRSMPDSKSKNSESSLGAQIWNKIDSFFQTHSLEVSIPKFLDTDNEARKKKEGYGGILLLAGAAKGAMIYMGMQAIAALAGKALIVAKVALTIASVIALKKLLEGSSGKTSYEIIKHPQHSYAQTHSSSHEYGGGGHGGGYEGHYRKRSIPRTETNVDQQFSLPTELTEASNLWRLELPKKQNFGVGLEPNSNLPDESDRSKSGAMNEGGTFFIYKQTAGGNQDETSTRNLLTLEIEGKNRLPQSNEGRLNNDNNFSSLRLRRSLVTKFA